MRKYSRWIEFWEVWQGNPSHVSKILIRYVWQLRSVCTTVWSTDWRFWIIDRTIGIISSDAVLYPRYRTNEKNSERCRLTEHQRDHVSHFGPKKTTLNVFLYLSRNTSQHGQQIQKHVYLVRFILVAVINHLLRVDLHLSIPERRWQTFHLIFRTNCTLYEFASLDTRVFVAWFFRSEWHSYFCTSGTN